MFRNVSIRIKIILGQIFLVAAVSIFIYTYYPNQQKRAAIESIEYKVNSIRNMFSIGIGIGMGETDLVAVSEALNWAHADSSVVHILITNSSNQKIASFTSVGTQVPAAIDSLKVRDKLYQIGKVFYCKTNIEYQKKHFGTLVIGYSLKALEESIRQLRLTTLYFCISLFVAGLIFSIVLSNKITANIRMLDNTVRSIAHGAKNVRVPVSSNDEIGKLSRAFNHMIHRLDKSRNEIIRSSEQLKKQNEELNQFSYVVSHDLKAPLRAIFKLSEWIEEDSKDTISNESKRNMQTLRSRVFRMEGLINGLLEYSKIGRTSIPIESVNVKTMLKETIDLLNPPAHITINIQDGMPVFKTKRVLLQQVFINLISNAIKYNDKKSGLINIGVSSNGQGYHFSVKDNGMGIAPQYHKKVFEIFQTLESRDKVEGTGIGLAILKKCVDDMGGKITLESEEGKGACFVFTWPIEEINVPVIKKITTQ